MRPRRARSHFHFGVRVEKSERYFRATGFADALYRRSPIASLICAVETEAVLASQIQLNYDKPLAKETPKQDIAKLPLSGVNKWLAVWPFRNPLPPRSSRVAEEAARVLRIAG